MDALLDLVTLGGAARNVAKIKFRQPLAEVRVQTADESVRRAVQRFPDQLVEELNVRRVTLQDRSNGDLLGRSVRLNKKSALAKLRNKAREAEAFLATADARKLEDELRRGPVEIAGVALDSTDILIEYQAADGWAGVADRATQVAIDARITDELAKEGLARDVIRHVQDQRKKAKLNMEDRIELYLGTDSERLRAAIDAHRDHIAAETLTARWTQAPNGDVDEVKIEGQSLQIALRRAR
jgi:isoleucyl-tRNA synthetase